MRQAFQNTHKFADIRGTLQQPIVSLHVGAPFTRMLLCERFVEEKSEQQTNNLIYYTYGVRAMIMINELIFNFKKNFHEAIK